jgi:hypothetical protein
MKKLSICLSFSLGLSFSGKAQQNLFNISSGAITPKGKVFYQHQLNIHSLYNMVSKHHLVYGLGKRWEAGINVVNIDLSPYLDRLQPSNTNSSRGAEYKAHGPLVMLTAQKQFPLMDNLSVNAGIQAGLGVPNRENGSHWSHFTYGILVYESDKHWRMVAGPYFSDRFLLGKGNRAGMIVGFEIPITKKIFLMGDFVSGNTKGSVSVVGFYYSVTPWFQLCLGKLIPNPQSKEQNGVVLEVNLFNF